MTTPSSLLRLLRTGDAPERVVALEGLVRDHPGEAADPAREGLADPAPEVRMAALRALSTLGLALAPIEMRELLEDPDEHVRSTAALQLDRLTGRPEARDLLRDRLGREASERVLATLVGALGRLGHPDDYPALVPLLHHPDGRIRANCLEALETLLKVGMVPAVTDLAEDSSNRVRGNLALLLSRFDPERAAVLIAAMAAHESKWFRLSAAWAAAESSHPALIEAVLPLLEDPEPDVQIQAVTAAGRYRELPVRRMVQALDRDDTDEAVRLSAKALLARLGA